MKKLFMLFLALAGLNFLSAQPVDQFFNSNGTYTVPAGYVAVIKIDVWGAGGGGGTNSGSRKGGGGGGAFASNELEVVAGTYTVNVGVGGTPSNPGGKSSVTVNTTSGMVLTEAEGGKSTTTQAGGIGGLASNSLGAIKWSGGNGGNGGNTNSGGGGGGGSAYSVSSGGCPNNTGNGCVGNNGSNGNNGAGGLGGAGTGNGGAGSNESGSPDAGEGFAPGGGGGGKGSGGGNSRDGADGRIIFTVQSVLPISLTSFNAYKKNDAVELKWSTASEINNDYMAVERSADGREFTEIGRVNGVGTSNDINNYAFMDKKPFTGVNYYRLRQVDFDGTSVYHQVLSVNMESAHKGIQLAAYPSQVNEVLNARWSNGKSSTILRILDLNGRELKRYSVPSGTVDYEISVNGLLAGMYLLQANQNGVVEVIHFTKL